MPIFQTHSFFMTWFLDQQQSKRWKIHFANCSWSIRISMIWDWNKWKQFKVDFFFNESDSNLQFLLYDTNILSLLCLVLKSPFGNMTTNLNFACMSHCFVNMKNYVTKCAGTFPHNLHFGNDIWFNTCGFCRTLTVSVCIMWNLNIATFGSKMKSI